MNDSDWFLRGVEYAQKREQLPELAALLKEVDELCDWLNYDFSLETIERELRQLNQVRAQHEVAEQKLWLAHRPTPILDPSKSNLPICSEETTMTFDETVAAHARGELGFTELPPDQIW